MQLHRPLRPQGALKDESGDIAGSCTQPRLDLTLVGSNTVLPLIVHVVAFSGYKRTLRNVFCQRSISPPALLDQAWRGECKALGSNEDKLAE